ncbi:MAG: beta-lactamase family protein [Deltaproteobacteria bacterium]|nr:beta-lactamase family protein [Deltaproteobacteria bacterium]
MSQLVSRRPLDLLFTLPLALAPACAGTDVPPDDAAFIQAGLEALAEGEVGEDTFGLGISIRLADGRVFRADAGHADPAQAAPYDVAATEQVIGSVTKLYTAVLVMQLVEAGELALDDTIDRWFDFPDAEAMTVRSLLQHTTGIRDFLTGMTLEHVSRPWTPDELLARALEGGLLGGPPLPQAIYSNTNSLLLGLILEAETGERWEDLIARRITGPLGLEHTYFAGEHDKADHLAGGWMLTPNGWVDTMQLVDPSIGWSVGGLVTTNAELLRFAAALFDGALFESPDTLDRMLRFDTVMDPTHLGEEPPSNVGLHVMRMTIDDVRLDGHLGHIKGFNAAAVRDPDTGALIVITSNDDRAFAGWIALEVARFVRAL